MSIFAHAEIAKLRQDFIAKGNAILGAWLEAASVDISKLIPGQVATVEAVEAIEASIDAASLERASLTDSISSVASGLSSTNSAVTAVESDVLAVEGRVTAVESDVLALAATIPDGVPVGTIIAFGFVTPPTGYLYCDGSAVSRSVYADLFALLGTTYGAGDGVTTFNLETITDVHFWHIKY